MAVLGFTPSKDFDDFVGIGARITEIKSKLIFQSENVKVIGLLGPGGIGKTTTARVLYNQLSHAFQFNTFLENIRGSYEKPCGNDYQLKLRLQKNLLSQIFNQSDIEVRHLGGAQEMLSDKKVLVVFDEVDNWWQLEEMAKQPGWVGPGSIIIITTEDRKLLKALRLRSDHMYEMKYPTRNESLEIFCQYAFGRKYPDNGFESLAWEVTWIAGDLPLGLRVMGSYLRGMSREEWIEALPWLRSTLDREIESTLRFSYNALRDNEKTLFLHIACFFTGVRVDSFKRLLRQMGREIVKKQSMKNPGKPLYLTGTNEIYDVLDEDTATGNVRGKLLCMTETINGRNKLQFLYFDSNPIPDKLILDKLILLHWNESPLRVWPSTFSGKLFAELVMQRSQFEMLWEGTKIPDLRMQKMRKCSHGYVPYNLPHPQLIRSYSGRDTIKGV
ncbi:disease resistance-like protein DSC2 [Brassica napus]|uniref:disease resistance-like protein DSC2 n=1 Tax=Brassica napus TaxID=3708 RepID=UPI00207914C5|nr:disease resistance-like protein DSC2 [Brassica napus]